MSGTNPTADRTAHYAAIGYLTAAWADFEQNLQRELWDLAGISGAVGAVLTANIGIGARFLDAIQALCLLRGADKRSMKSLGKLAGKSLALAKLRNRAIHDPWGFGENGEPYRLEISAAKELKLGAVPTTTAELRALTKEILAHATNFEGFMRALKVRLASLPHTTP